MEFGIVSKAFNQINAPSGISVLYLDLPIHLKMNMTSKLNLLLGPELSYKLSSFQLTSFQYGISGGANLRISERWGFRVRYSHSLNRFTEYSTTDANGSVVGCVKAYYHGISLSGLYYIN